MANTASKAIIAAAQGNVVFDAALHIHRLSTSEVATVRKNLETAWK